VGHWGRGGGHDAGEISAWRVAGVGATFRRGRGVAMDALLSSL
jgi:hypothetical protein